MSETPRRASGRSSLSDGTFNSAAICKAFKDRGINTQFTGSPCPDTLHGGGMCRADLNYDGALDIVDCLEFHRMFAGGDPFCDFTGDGKLDFFDVIAFQKEFAAGCW